MMSDDPGGDRPLHILQLHNEHVVRGGANQVIERERELLSDAGHVVSTHMERTEDYVHRASVRRASAVMWNAGAYGTVSRIVASRRPDVVHLHTPFPFMSPSVIDAAAKHGVPVVMTSHSYRLACIKGTLERDGSPCRQCIGSRTRLPAVVNRCYQDSLTNSLGMALSSSVHRVRGTFRRKVAKHLALTPYLRDVLIADGIDPAKIIVHPNFVPDPGSDNGPRSGLVFVGRLVPEKGIATLAEAWSLLGSSAPELTIIGSGPEIAQFDRDPGANVRVLGEIANNRVFDIVRRSEALVFPSTWPEGLGVAWIEALAVATPVIYSDVGNFSDLLDEIDAGMRFRSGDASSLAGAVRALTALDSATMAEMGQRGRDAYEERFSPQQALRRLESIYRSVL